MERSCSGLFCPGNCMQKISLFLMESQFQRQKHQHKTLLNTLSSPQIIKLSKLLCSPKVSKGSRSSYGAIFSSFNLLCIVDTFPELHRITRGLVLEHQKAVYSGAAYEHQKEKRTVCQSICIRVPSTGASVHVPVFSKLFVELHGSVHFSSKLFFFCVGFCCSLEVIIIFKCQANIFTAIYRN